MRRCVLLSFSLLLPRRVAAGMNPMHDAVGANDMNALTELIKGVKMIEGLAQNAANSAADRELLQGMNDVNEKGERARTPAGLTRQEEEEEEGEAN